MQALPPVLRAAGPAHFRPPSGLHKSFHNQRRLIPSLQSPGHHLQLNVDVGYLHLHVPQSVPGRRYDRRQARLRHLRYLTFCSARSELL
ncbi:hypothetical protein GOP47_0025400 [Adiantum capillus-veneris]|uniref:Uncharacterized protein n=1 Tax=Adiantum capillus-veneris TaxID=13818 RepID=A0A9D4Z430_ADICA|nr:hypothetical protein GOP47_0025400 [Adiantum capillus-veneris]